MANGERTPDPEDSVLRYGVRSGLKREFAFALKAQAELPVSLSRTRSGKPHAAASPPSAAGGNREKKRPKKSSAGDPTPRDARAQEHEAAEAATGPSPAAPGFSRIEAEANVAVNGQDRETKNSENSAEESKPNCSSLSQDDGAQGNQDVVKLKDETMAEVAEVNDAADVGKSMEDPENMNKVIPGTPVAIKCSDKSAVDAPHPPVKPIKVFVRSPKRGKAEVSAKCSPPLVPSSEFALNDDGGCAFNVSRENVCDMEHPRIAEINTDSNVNSIAMDSSAEISTRLADNGILDAAAAGTSIRPVILEESQSLQETPSRLDGQDGPVTGNSLPEKPPRRFTRSLLKATPPAQTEGLAGVHSVKEHDRPVDDASKLDKPIRRFTRSQLKSQTEDSGAGEGTSMSSESSGSEETKGRNADPLDSSAKRKMELKMSKKIALTKPPSNVRELISTGLLEGLPVNYSLPSGRQIELQGVIRGNGILCSCASCKAYNVVSAYVFEQHAGSTKKHPSDFIYLQNGSNLRDVLRACTGASLDTLKAAILSAVGPWPLKKLFTCQKCKVSFLTTRTGKFALLCDECLDGKQAPKTPASNANAITPRITRASLAPDSSDSHSKSCSTTKKVSYGKLTRKDLGLHKLVFMDDILPQGTEVGYYVRGKRLLEGYIKDSGIFCRCCEKVVSPSQFEAHAGRASRRKPYNNIYTSNGVSLHELSVSLSKDRKLSANENDDLCSICADGGNLLLCDLCPRAFHKECVGLSSIPKGDWHCQYCVNLRQRERSVAFNGNAIAAGRVAGADPIDEIFRRCIRIVTTSVTDVGGCVLCRLHHFSKSEFNDHTVIICDQCEKEYHVGCLRDNQMADLKELPEDEWFCCADCSSIRASLQEFVHCGAQPISLLDVDLIKRKCDSKGITTDVAADIRWRLLSGQAAKEDTKLLLSRAVALFHESFDPIIDAGTGRDLIPTMVYGREVRDQDYRGMYCAILTVGSSVVSAGILRVLGSTVAELPLVATIREHQGLGYFQSLFSCIERLLGSLSVKHFVLPAADEAESIWTKKFGFTKITSDQLQKYSNGTRITFFQGTSMLHKLVPSAKIQSQG